MISTEWHYPAVASNVDRGDSEAWLNVENVVGDTLQAATNTPGKDLYSDWLRCWSYGFDSDVPEDVIILGIELEMQRRCNADQQDFIDSVLKLRKSTGQVGENKATADQYAGPFASDEEQTAAYGGADDDWGAGLTAADIRTLDFGVDYSCLNATQSTLQGSVVLMRIRVIYEEGSGSSDAVKLISRQCSDGHSHSCSHKTWEWDKQ